MHSAPSLTQSDASPAGTVASLLAEKLREMGVAQAFGVMGGAIAPFFKAVFERDINVVHCRHEAGAAFAAIEASIATRRPVLVFTTAGPGISNAITGMLAARWEGAQVIFVSACSSPAHRGRVATQETTQQTMLGTGLYMAGGPLHFAATIDHPQQLGPTLAQLANGLRRPGAFVAHVSLPIASQNAMVAAAPVLPSRPRLAANRNIAAEHASLLSQGSFVIWVGFGARHASESVRRLAERSGARVMCSPRAKGVFPEDHPQFLGVTGLGGHTEVDDALAADRPDYILVLGTRMGESTSFWASELTPAKAFLHVDIDPSVFGTSYPEVQTIGVAADVEEYLQSLNELLPAATSKPERRERPRASLSARTAGAVRPQLLLQEVQRVFVDRAGAWLMAESGNAFCWATHLLRFNEPGRYRVSTGFGSMGHATSSVMAAALTHRRQAVALVGDGAMMMMNELHTAVQYRADAVWIVLNDSCYLMCAQGMQMMGWEPFSCELPPVDFVALAKAVGAQGVRIERETDVREALESVARMTGPVVVDVSIDRAEVPPTGRRNRSLMQQGFGATNKS